MNANIKDIINQKFGELTVVKMSETRDSKGHVYWICRCDCGRFVEVRGDNLRSGNTNRCSDCSQAGKRSNFVNESVI